MPDTRGLDEATLLRSNKRLLGALTLKEYEDLWLGFAIPSQIKRIPHKKSILCNQKCVSW